jgi:uncharacterized membrane protein
MIQPSKPLRIALSALTICYPFVILFWFHDSPRIARLYPALVNAALLGIFGSTLFLPPNMAFRFAKRWDKTIQDSPWEGKVEAYCKKVTLVWCVFFVLNGGTALYTAFETSEKTWSIYTGCISYILIGLVFGVEYCIRKAVNRKIRERSR